MRRLFSALILVLLAAMLVGWAVANRQAVVISLDPFDSTNTAYSVTAPLYLVAFATLIAGVLMGGAAAWIEQGRARRARLRIEAELGAVRAELHEVKRHAGDGGAQHQRPRHAVLFRGAFLGLFGRKMDR
jgi:uncharacterized integral membrane protein